MRIRVGAAGAGALLVAALLTGCAQSVPASSASASPTATTSAASPSGSATTSVCGDAAALQQSIAQLQDLNLVADGTTAAKQDLQQVQQDVTRLVDSAKTQSAKVVSQVESDIASIQSTLGTAAATPSPSTVAQVRTEVSALDQDARTLIEEVASGC